MANSAIQLYSDRNYQNQGNHDLISKIRIDSGYLLDVGCGAGDNARLISTILPEICVVGITASSIEYAYASIAMKQCIVADIEQDEFSSLSKNSFDCLLLSHVLEHVRDPALVLSRLLPYLKNNGQVLIAVPNIAYYLSRWQLMLGRFEYASSGVFDETHLHFFTYYTADAFILHGLKNLELVEKSVTGSVPLWYLRRKLLNRGICKVLDSLGSKMAPNLFGAQIILDLKKIPDSENNKNK